MKPWDHQIKNVQNVLQNKTWGIFDDMGTGKSYSAIEVLNQIYETQGQCKTLIVCPCSVIEVWPYQFQKHSRIQFDIYAPTNLSVPKKAGHIKRFLHPKMICVLNYEAIWRAPLAQILTSIKWDCIFLDESHRISAPGSKVSWFCKSLQANYKVLLTGTPLRTPLSIYAQYRFLNPKIFGKSFNAFKTYYANEINMGTFKKVVSYKNLDDLYKRIYCCASRVKRENVLELPAVTNVILKSTMPKEMQKVYNELHEDLIAQWEQGIVSASNALVKALRLQQLTGGYIRFDDGTDFIMDSPKHDQLKDLLEDLPEDEPFVVFCRYTNEIQRIKEFKITDRTFAELSGHMNQLQEWQAGKYNTLVVQIRSGGVGIDMTRSCYAAYLSTGYDPLDYQQSMARLDRQGQNRPVTLYHLMVADTIDEKIHMRLEEKHRTTENLLDGNINTVFQKEAIDDAIKSFLKP